MNTNIPKLLVLLGVALSLWATPSTAADCAYTYNDEPCPEGRIEAFKDATPSVLRMCCDSGSKRLKREQGKAADCRNTDCETSKPGEMCDYLGQRTVNGTVLEYEEIMRDTCTKSDGSEGALALCCVRESPEAILMTLLGAELNEFPHQAKLFVPGHCGGTIYNNKWIITAAHCIVDGKKGKVSPISEMKVLLGTNNAEIEEEGQNSVYTYKVKRAIPHEQYSKLSTHPEFSKPRRRTYNDIALLELDREIKFSDKVKALEMAPENFDPFKYASSAVIIGWGRDERDKPSSHLHKANFLLRNEQVCTKAWENGYWVEGHQHEQLCVGGVAEGKWSPTGGTGDSGGGAVCRDSNGHPVHCGVTSFGPNKPLCDKTETEADCPPTIYTRVAHYRDWIKGYAGEQNEEQFYRPFLYGKKVSKGEADHQVHISSTNGKFCGGTLIANNFVLTAQHCVVNDDGTQRQGIKVTTGIYNLGETGKIFGVAGLVPYKGFQRVGKPVDVQMQGHRVFVTDNQYENDLALIKLDGEVENVENFPKLPKSGTVFKQGVELAFPRDSKFGEDLRSREYKILDHGDCQRRMDRLAKSKFGKVTVEKNILCGVEIYSGGSSCDRELGGGLICKEDNGDVLCGVQTFRLCELSVPNGFLNLAYGGVPNWVERAKKAL